MLWDVFLAVAILALSGLGLFNASTALLLFGLAAALAVVIVARRQRERIGRGLAALGVRAGGEDAVARYLPPPEPVHDPIAAAVEVARRGERRTAVRDVRSAITDGMVSAEKERDHGADADRSAAIAAANRAAAIVSEVDDPECRRRVRASKTAFDAIPKGYQKDGRGGLVSIYGSERKPPGYPEPAWSALRELADEANDRLGAILREL
jgi:hypothetical protein